MFSPARLKLARQRRGLTLTKLAEESQVSLRSLTNYENGITDPTPESLERLAEAVGLPVAYFHREHVDPLAVEAVSFRKLSKTSATRRDAVLSSAVLALELFDVINRHFKLPAPAIPTLDKLPPEEAAEVVRRDWGLADKPISNMVHLLESKGVRVVALAHDYKDIDAFCFYRDSVPFVFVNTTKSAERQRFDAAHELAHLVLHDERDMVTADSKQREAEANAFAAAFLMPASGLYGQIMNSASLDRIFAAKKFWKVSAMALTHRLRELSLLNEWQYRSTVMTLSQAGYRNSEPDGILPEASQLLRKVLFGPKGVSLSKAADELAVPSRELRALVQGLVPVAA